MPKLTAIHAEFVKSSSDYKQCPELNIPEFTFSGRSNVGKSSLINMLVGQKSLAKVSGKPGKTTLINHFLVNNSWYLADLPGYGYASRSKKERASWEVMIKNYLLKRQNLATVFLLVDSRIPPQQSDIETINWMGANHLPVCIVFTKADKQSANKTDHNIAQVKKSLRKTWEELPPYFITSSVKKQGREDILQYIDQVNKSLE
mgnify:CR=1 FL=1